MRLLSGSQLKVLYGELEIFSGIDVEVDDKARIGMVGPNGGGKTSLLRVIVGELAPNGGTVARHDGLRIGYVPQIPAQTTDGSLGDDIMKAFEKLKNLEDSIASSGLEIQRADGTERRQAERRYSALLEEYEALGGYDYQNRMERVVAGVGLSLETLNTPIASASGGERTRAALAKALLTDPDLLVLDEPTNYLDFKGLNWLEGFLSHFSHAFVVVSHDRYFLDKTVNHIWELDHGRIQSFPGNYSKYKALKAEQVIRQQKEFERQQEYIAKEEYFIQRYKAGQRAREAKGREKRLERLERLQAPETSKTVHIGRATATRTGQIAIRTDGLEVGFIEGGHQVKLLSVPDVKLERGSRTGIIGSNGAGKTTMLQTMLGMLPPLAGSASLGHSVKAGYYRQGSDDLPMDSTVLDALLDIKNLQIDEARNYLARFLFQGEDVYKAVSSLSGGERSRLSLARLLLTQPNILVLDEPTTHLDIPSREALEEVLLAYEGALLFVSHDRLLISRLAQQLWIVEDGSVQIFAGTFDEWMQSTLEAQPQTSKPKKSTTARRAPAPKAKKAQSKTPAIDHEKIIAELETKLGKIERNLQRASARQNVADIARLGEEYNDTQARLEQAWSEWSE
ncbi:MAG: ABC-F family ATP-binding cassette domain-containing protein [Chloroflexi bacterium]|nr:ABC-F family ATP-binding cassette domain-containing protein [Chloroflexota bacterium]